MVNKIATLLLFELLPLLTVAQKDTLATKQLASVEMTQDFNYLRRLLTETHPGLYRYSSKEKMQTKMDSIYLLLAKPMAFYDYYLLLSELIANVRCAHTHLTPTNEFEKYYLNNIKTFPFMIFYTEGKYYVTINGTNNNTIKPGFELLSINGERIEMVRTKMLKYLWADGYNETGKTKATSEAYFPLFYYLFIARPERFNLVFKNLNGEEVKIVVPAQPFKETQKFFSKNPVNESILKIYGPKNKLDRKKGWRLQVRKKEDVAIMRINGFGGGKSEEEARGIMRHFLDGCMAKLEKDKIRNLIIDLRYNSGGWDIQGVELFTYLIKEPTRCYRRLHSVSDSSEFLKFSDLSSEDMKNVQNELKKEADGTFSIKEEFSPQLKLQSPKPNRFTGNILVLANGGSASTTSEFVAYTKSNKSAIIIGEETGGAYEGGNGGSYIHLELPNSKINVATPLLYYDNEVTEPIQKGRGTMPDFEVHSSLEEVLKGYDRPLNFALEFIKKQNIK